MRFKARPATRGFEQTLIVDNKETFATVIRFITESLSFSIVVIEDLELHQRGVKSDVLSGDVYEDIYMEDLKKLLAKAPPDMSAS